MRTGPLQLDYRNSGGPSRPSMGMGLLAFGVGALAVALAACFEISRDLEEARAQVEELQIVAKRRTNAFNQNPGEAGADNEVARANTILRQLHLPWNELFNAIESSKGESIALLSIIPDAQLRVLKLAGEAKDLGDVLEYLKRLGDVPLFENVYLLDHEIARQNSQKIVRFTISANWKGAS